MDEGTILYMSGNSSIYLLQCFITCSSITFLQEKFVPRLLVAKASDEIILPCHLKPAVDVAAKMLEWTR